MKPLSDRVGVLFAIASLAFLGSIAGRTVVTARAELKLASAQRDAKEPMRAIEHYRRSLRWSFPSSPYVDDAVAGLESIAREAERAGDRPAALLAWRSLAGGLASTRSFLTGEAPARARAKAEIARLLANGPVPAIDAHRDADQIAADHRELLAHEASPDRIGGVLLLVGFTAWIGSVVLLARRGFDSSGRPVWSRARVPLWSALVAFATFVLGLVFA